MKGRRVRVLAWGLCAIVILGAVVQVVLWATRLGGAPTSDDAGQHLGWGLALPLVFSVLAAMIIAHQPGNRVGWLMMIVGLALTNPLSLALGLALDRLSGPPATITLGLWLGVWLSGWSWTLIIFPVFLIPLFFPTGAPPTPRWRWVAWLAIGMWVAFLFLSAFSAQIEYGSWTMDNPIGLLPAGFWEGGFNVAWSIGLVTVIGGSVASLYVRYRRAGSGERQQIKWLLFAGAFFAVIYALAIPLSDQALFSWWMNLLFIGSILGIPIAIAVAIFRYRLWDLDVVVNRALIYGLLTTLLAGIFAAVIAVITEAGKDLLGQGSRAAGAAISALVVAGVFQPLRTWIEGGVNKRFYPQKHDLTSGMVEVQPEFWGFLDRASLVRISLDHVRRVLGTRHAAVFLAVGQGEFRRAAAAEEADGGSSSIWIPDKQRRELERKRVIAAETTGPLVGHVPVYVDRGKATEILGLLSIGPRENGKGYSGDELKGLAELGGKIGLALNAIQLGGASK
ncbi:MAG TPA: hypothetical protein VK449_05065 [Anaerolineales bacterium]|nr:hypothetical protein [Anaerolineales bacterium]